VYGELQNVVGEKQACPFRWPGQYEDEETGLYYNRFRYYDPEAGGYVSQDPIGLAGGLCPSAYVADPLVWQDPLGLSSCQDEPYAEVSHYAGNEDNPFGHYAVRVVAGDQEQFSHQVITSSDHSHTTISERPPQRAPETTARVPLTDPSKAMDYQRSMMGKELGPYDRRTNSCVDHVAEVLRQGGVDVPQGPLGQFKYMRGLGL
jgi:RHS repeat-associated protein